MPEKGGAARLLADLNAEHAPPVLDPLLPDPQKQTNEESNERYNVTTLQESLSGSHEETKEETVAHSNAALQKATKERERKPSSGAANVPAKEPALRSDEREERLRKALQIASGDELDVATIRVSAKLHAYLERYVERINRINPKAKYRKQDAITAAFAAFYADHPMPPAPVEEEL